MQEIPFCLGMPPSGIFTAMHQWKRKQVMTVLPSIPKRSPVLLPTLHLLFVIQEFPWNKKKERKSKTLTISVNINVQIYVYYLKEHSCSLTASLSTSCQIPFSKLQERQKNFAVTDALFGALLSRGIEMTRWDVLHWDCNNLSWALRGAEVKQQHKEACTPLQSFKYSWKSRSSSGRQRFALQSQRRFSQCRWKEGRGWWIDCPHSI